MFLILVILGFLSVPAYSKPFFLDDVQSRLKGGEVLQEYSPFLCGIYYEDPTLLQEDDSEVPPESKSFACSGVLVSISSEYSEILTSGYCLKSVFYVESRDVFVVCGAKAFNYKVSAPDGPNVFKSGVLDEMVNVTYHPLIDTSIVPVETFKHCNQTMWNDIAVIRFSGLPDDPNKFYPLPIQLNDKIYDAVEYWELPLYIEAWGGDTCSRIATDTQRALAYIDDCGDLEWEESPNCRVELRAQQFCAAIYTDDDSPAVLTAADWGGPLYTEIVHTNADGEEELFLSLIGLSSFATIPYPFGTDCSDEGMLQVNVKLSDPLIAVFICQNTAATFAYTPYDD